MIAALRLHAAPRPQQRVFATEPRLLYIFLALSALTMPIGLVVSGLRLVSAEFGMAGGILAFIVWFALCLRRRGMVRIATALEAWAVFTACCLVITLSTFMLATGQRPFVDVALAAADRMLLPWFDWPRTMRAFARSGTAVRVANAVYESILWQPQSAIVLLSMTVVPRRVWHFVLSWTLTLCLIVALFTFLPALGAYAHFGIAASDVPALLDPTPWRQPEILHRLRDGSLRVVSLAELDGIITFPSFHAAAAVLLGYAFWTIRWLRWPFALLNVLMLASAVPVGGHYIVDIVAGIAVAAVGIWASEAMLSLNATWASRVFSDSAIALPATPRSGRAADAAAWRPDRESNPGARICSPLRHHSAIGPR